ncbi:hypothetical protein PR048_033403 [Dryococelus australis]|uniref:Uncharacterized protein n=1 Tax=Dryococelus australis TaxID=614101 RepID=A0ABQ9G079_9NEOP|nr:hypothetical protein PR048_033403 [Dryococelus australis]
MICKLLTSLTSRKFSKDTRIHSVRSGHGTNEAIEWTEITELRVRKTDRQMIFFKTHPSERSYRCLSLKRQDAEALIKRPTPLVEPPKLTREKYPGSASLVSRTNTGDTIRDPQ